MTISSFHRFFHSTIEIGMLVNQILPHYAFVAILDIVGKGFRTSPVSQRNQDGGDGQ
jgi:hypothetical protein